MFVVESADEDHRISGGRVRAGFCHGLVTQFARAILVFGIGTLGILKAFLLPAFVLVDLFGVVAERVFDFDVAAELAVEAEQRGYFVQRFDDGRAAAVGVDAVGVGTDDQQTGHVAFVERQQVRVVFQQHDGFAGDVQCLRRVVERRVTAWFAACVRVAEHVQRVHDGDHAFDFPVDVAFLDVAVFHGFLQRVGEVVIVEIRRDGHFDIHADFGAGFGVAHRAPVGNDETVETVFVAQDVVEQLLVFAAFGAVDEIVGAHDGEHAAVLYRRFEGRQVDFA